MIHYQHLKALSKSFSWASGVLGTNCTVENPISLEFQVIPGFAINILKPKEHPQEHIRSIHLHSTQGYHCVEAWAKATTLCLASCKLVLAWGGLEGTCTVIVSRIVLSGPLATQRNGPLFLDYFPWESFSCYLLFQGRVVRRHSVTQHMQVWQPYIQTIALLASVFKRSTGQ